MTPAIAGALGFVLGAKLTLCAVYIGFQWALRTPQRVRLAPRVFGGSP